MLINNSYFKGENLIPNAIEADVTAIINSMTQKYEPDYLQKALGYELSELFITGIAEVTPDQRFIDLKMGKVFTDSRGMVQKWGGFAPEISAGVPDINTPIADYVFYFILNKDAIENTGIGTAKPAAKNAVIVSPADKMCFAWNEMVRKTKTLVAFLNANMGVYPEFRTYAGSEELEILLTRLIPGFN